MIDISQVNYCLYSPQELRDYAIKGLLECKGVDLTKFLECFLEGMMEEGEHQKIIDDRDSYWDGDEDEQRGSHEWGEG